QTCALPISYIVFTVFPFYFSLRLRLSRATLGKSPVATLHKESPPKGGELDPRLRGRCPLARFACFPHVRHVAGVHGGRASPYFMPLPPSVGRYGQHQGCGFARNAHPFGARSLRSLRSAAASAFALDTVLR